MGGYNARPDFIPTLLALGILVFLAQLSLPTAYAMTCQFQITSIDAPSTVEPGQTFDIKTYLTIGCPPTSLRILARIDVVASNSTLSRASYGVGTIDLPDKIVNVTITNSVQAPSVTGSWKLEVDAWLLATGNAGAEVVTVVKQPLQLQVGTSTAVQTQTSTSTSYTQSLSTSTQPLTSASKIVTTTSLTTSNQVTTTSTNLIDFLFSGRLSALGAIATAGSIMLGWLFKTRKRRFLSGYLTKIDSTFNSYAVNREECKGRLYQMRDDVSEMLKKGKIDETHFGILEGKLSQYLRDLSSGERAPSPSHE